MSSVQSGDGNKTTGSYSGSKNIINNHHDAECSVRKKLRTD